MSGIDDILAGYESLRTGQEALDKDLHQHPELSHAEHRIARRVAGFIIASGTGVAGVLAHGTGPTVLLRCELDALPLREATAAPYAATATARDASGQEVPADHACGHDMHMACMTGMATLMAARRDRWHGTLIALFQPAEETGEGAQDMVDGRAGLGHPGRDAVRQRAKARAGPAALHIPAAQADTAPPLQVHDLRHATSRRGSALNRAGRRP